MKNKRKILTLTGAALAFVLNSCDPNINISEQTMGPYLTVCTESYTSYNNTNRLIDSLKTELGKIDVKPEKTFGIFYQKYNTDTYHSIVGCIVGTDVTDSVLIRKLERANFMVRIIGETNCMTYESEYQDFNTKLRTDFQETLSEYSKSKNYEEIPYGEIGIAEIYENGKIHFAAEIKPAK